MAAHKIGNMTTPMPVIETTPKYLDMTTYLRLQTFKENYAEVHGYISVVVCLFGIMANIANIVVLNKKHMRTSTNVLLLWLAVADLCTMLEYVTFGLKFYVFKEKGLAFPETRYFGWICYLLFHANFSITMHSISIWLTIMLALFRFLYIFYPHRGSIYCSISHANMIIIIVHIAALIVCIPNYISNYWQLTTKNVGGENISVYTFKPRRDGNFIILFDLNYWVHSIIIKLVPCFLLTVLTILLVYALHKAQKRHAALMSQGHRNQDDEAKHHEHYRTTAMLLAVVILFLLTELPQGILTLLMIFMDNLHNELYNPLGDILDIAALLNNAINFVLYCTMSQQFRQTFVDTFCSCCKESEASKWAKRNLILNTNGHTKSTMVQTNGDAV